MLKLLIFAPCDKGIVANNGQCSLVGVLEAVQVGIAKELPPEAMIPYKWCIMTLWHREAEVAAPIKYHEQIEVFRPDGVPAMKVETEFEVNNNFRGYRQHMDIPFLPAGLSGQYLLKLSLQKEGEESREIATFPMQITHTSTEVNFEQEP